VFLQEALSRPAVLVSRLIALIVAITIHEFAHSFIAWRMGDPTAKEAGQVTLNPLKHINPVGFLMFLIIGFGFLGQAPVNPRRMRNPRWGMTAAVAAGPISNLLMAVLFAIPWWLGLLPTWPFRGSQLLPSLTEIGFEIIFWNVLLFFFNLIPLYPLDGWTVVLGLLPTDLAYTWERYQMQSYYLFFFLILLSFLPIPGIPSPLGLLIAQPTSTVVGFLTGLG
jgi:Zn-dependent protease